MISKAHTLNYSKARSNPKKRERYRQETPVIAICFCDHSTFQWQIVMVSSRFPLPDIPATTWTRGDDLDCPQ